MRWTSAYHSRAPTHFSHKVELTVQYTCTVSKNSYNCYDNTSLLAVMQVIILSTEINVYMFVWIVHIIIHF